MRASFKTIDITGSIGMRMSGFAEREHGNVGVHDPVLVKIAVIESAGSYLAMAACDCIGVDLNGVSEIRRIVSERTPIRPENILIAATHTHASYQAVTYGATGFRTRMLYEPKMGEQDRAYYETFKAKIIGGIIWAYETLEEVRVGYAHSTLEGLGTNRNDPHGYDDNTVNVLRVERPDGALLGALVNYGCHPTVLPWQNYLISADYPGYTRDLVQQTFPGSTCMFLQGTSGGASTRFTRRGNTFEEAQRFGYLLGAEALKLLCHIETHAEELPISAKLENLVLKVKSFPSDEFLLNQIDSVKSRLKFLEETNADERETRKQYVTLLGAERTYQMKQFIRDEQAETQMQLVKLGELNFITIPGEPFAEIGRDIKAVMGEKTFVLGYTNDYIGYLVSNEGLLTEGYEKFMTPFDATTHERIVDTAVRLYRDLA